MNGTRRIYVDNAATTALRPEARAAMLEALETAAYNPSSVHAEGRRAKAGLTAARERVARRLGAAPREVIFTSGGSESINLALTGLARACRAKGRHILSVVTEHAAALRTLEGLEREGFEVELLPVHKDGQVDVERFGAALRDDTVLASVMLVNNELGTIAPVAELAAAAHARGAVFHTDAVQAAGRLALDVTALGIDALSLSAHKLCGPKGVGALYLKSGTALVPFLSGGSQEAGLRAGTENVAGIAGLATALDLAGDEREPEAARLTALRERFERGLAAAIPGVRINGGDAPRAPHICSVAFADCASADLTIALDLAGVAASAGSACASGSLEPSHVIAAISPTGGEPAATVRFSFGRSNSEQEVATLLATLRTIVARQRESASNLGTKQRGSGSSRSEGTFS